MRYGVLGALGIFVPLAVSITSIGGNPIRRSILWAERVIKPDTPALGLDFAQQTDFTHFHERDVGTVFVARMRLV